MRYKNIIGILCFLIAGLNMTSAQESNDNFSRLSQENIITILPTDAVEIERRLVKFIESISQAVNQNPLLTSVKSSNAVDNDAVNIAKSALYPRVSMSVRGGTEFKKPTGIYSSDSIGRTDLVLSAKQLLYDFGATNDNIAAARFTEKSSRFSGISTVEQLTLRAVNTYLIVATLRDKVKLSKANYSRHETIIDMVIDRIEGKIASVSDLDQALSRLAIAEAQLANFIGELGRAEASFKEIYNKDAGDILFPVVHIKLPSNDQNIVDIAINNHPKVKAISMLVEAARHGESSAENSNLPKFMLELDLTKYDILPTYDKKHTRGKNEPYGAVVNLNIIYDIFDGGAGVARVSSATHKLAKIISERDMARLEAGKSIGYSYANANATKLTLNALQLALESSKNTVNANMEKYKIGSLGVLDLLDGQASHYKAAVRFYGGRVDVVNSQFDVLLNMGGLLEYFNVNMAKDYVGIDNILMNNKAIN